MDVEISLNELSIIVVNNKYIACSLLKSFCELLADITHKLGISYPILRTPRDLLNRTLAQDFRIYNWLNDPSADRESTTYFLSVSTVLPYIDDELSEEDRNLFLTTEARHRGEIARGLLFAYKRNGLALSIQSSNVWDTPFLSIDVQQINENADIENYSAKVRHSSNQDNLRIHLPWLENLRYAAIKDGTSLLEESVTKFPDIIFLGNTQQQIKTLSAGDHKLKSLIRSLILLQEYCTNWTSGNIDISALRVNGLYIRAESEATLRQFGSVRQYYDSSGGLRFFRWHFNINPGNWRGYIDWDNAKREIWLTYVGPHLPTKRFR